MANRWRPSAAALMRRVEANRPPLSAGRMRKAGPADPPVGLLEAEPESAIAHAVGPRQPIGGAGRAVGGAAHARVYRETSGRSDPWASTEDAARLIGGVTPRWVRGQIEARRLRARVLLTGRRVTYRIRLDDLDQFIERYVVDDASIWMDGVRDDLTR